MKNKNRVGLGTFPLSSVFSPISISSAEKLVKEFIDLGGFYFDTAPLYGKGEVESLLGRVLKNIPRDKYYLGTKTVKYIDFVSGKYNDVITQTDKSLQRLNLDFVDQLMVHEPDPNVPIEETLIALEKLQKDGKVKELAVSNVNLEELKAYNQTGKIRYIQNRFSLINRSLSPGFKKYLLDNKIFLIPWHLLEIGQLTGKSFKLRKGDLREGLVFWNYENQKIILEWTKKYIEPIAKRLNISVNQLVIAWTLSQPFINYVVVGTTKLDNLKSNLAANEIRLSEEILNEVEVAYGKLEKHVQEHYGKTIKDFRGLNEKFY